MTTVRVKTIDWPLGDSPNWENNNDGDAGAEEEETTGLKSIADSLVILQSLRQSRDKWLYSTFPRFSSKSRGNKGLEITPPPHTIHNRGRCDIQIGPHIFPSTVVFEVHYQYMPPLVNASQYVYQPLVPNHGATWQTTTPYGKNPNLSQGKTLGSDQAAQASHPISASVEAVVSQKTSSPLLSSLGAEVPITPGLVTQVNIAAASNPTLANLLQMAASGQATPDQLKTLALLIQSLACISSNDEPPDLPRTISKPGSVASQPDDACNPSTAAPVYTPRTAFTYPIYRPSKEFDIVFEFSENSSDRWILPRSPAIIEDDKRANNGDLLLTVGVPFEIPPLQVAQLASSGTNTTQHLVNFRFHRVSDDIKSCLSRWHGGQQSIEVTRKAMNAIFSNASEKVYLAHQLQPGPQLTQLQNAVLPPYTLKSIRPVQGDPTKPKRVRKPAVRKTAVISADAPVLSLQIQPAIPAVVAPSENAALTQPSEQPQTISGPSSQAQIPQIPASKQRRQSKAQSTLPKMACDSCGQTNIPLVKGGKLCKPCAGAEQVIPGVPANGSTFLHKFWAVSTPEQMQAQTESAVQSRQQTPATSKRKAAFSRNQSTINDSITSPDEQASSSVVIKKKKAK